MSCAHLYQSGLAKHRRFIRSKGLAWRGVTLREPTRRCSTIDRRFQADGGESMPTNSKHPETQALHAGSYRSDRTTGAVAVPIYQTTSYQFEDTQHAANLFAL